MIHRALVLSMLGAGSLAAQAHHGDDFGTVHFNAACSRAVTTRFDHAMALLHSFEFSRAIQEFGDVALADPACPMAYWGIALSRWGNPLAAGIRNSTLLANGRAATEMAATLAAGGSDRVHGYVAAVAELSSFQL